MATKLKNNKFFVTIISCLVLVCLSVGMYMAYPNIEKHVEENKENYFDHYEFYEQMAYHMYLTYIDAVSEANAESFSTIEKVYEVPTKNLESIYSNLVDRYCQIYGCDDYDEYAHEELDLYDEYVDENLELDDEVLKDITKEVRFSQLSQDKQIELIKELLVELLSDDINSLKCRYTLENLYYFAINKTNNQTYSYYGYTDQKLLDLSTLIDNSTGQNLNQLKEDYQYFVVLDYDERGRLTVSHLYENTPSRFFNIREISDIDQFIYGKALPFSSIKNMTFVYGVPKQLLYTDDLNSNTYGYWPTWRSIQEMSFYYDWIAFAILAIFVLITPLKSISEIKFINRILRWPIESLLLTGGLPFAFFIELLPNMIYSTIENQLVMGIPEQAQIIFTTAINLVGWFLAFAWMFILFVYIKNLFKLGFKTSFTERCWVYRIGRAIIKKCIKFFMVNLTKKNAWKLMLFIGIQYIFITCLFVTALETYNEFLMLFSLLVYSVVLFIVLYKLGTRVEQNYVQLFKMVKELADGKLDGEVKEDLGLFNVIKEEIMNIQIGFKKAVQAEVRSQRMRTDLIANVSHDLKTPLTSIITYTDLLKDETLDEQKRAQYLDTLDQKAQRLKVLIEDLFEMSKASSGNISMNLQEVEVVSLMKQTLLELEDKIEASNLIIRRNFPEHKVLLMLDSDRTFRVFDNLILNMTKYAMPRTRAYLDIIDNEEQVQIIFKNMSADEITVDVDELTERFVRGDQARHTEGSGLGLAIAKSFVELQGGIFNIQIDGDLFKVILTFNK